MANKKRYTLRLDVEQLEALQDLSQETRVPLVVLARIAISRYLDFINAQRPAPPAPEATLLMDSEDADRMFDDDE